MVLQEKHKNVPIPEGIHRKLKMKCAKNGETIKDVLVRLIQEYLRENK